MQHDAIIVGGGLFGSVIAAQLRSQGRSVLVLDSNEKGAGSKPAACLMKPSWFSSMGKDKFEPSLELLDRLYGVADIHFKLQPTRGHATVHWCDPKKILVAPDIDGKVLSITPGSQELGGNIVEYQPSGTSTYRRVTADLVVVAAGIWSAQLVPIEGGLQGQAGVAFLWPQLNITSPFIQPWAPYRQLVAFNRGDGLWVGDGSAIKQSNWNEQRENMSYSRSSNAIGRVGYGDRERGEVKSLFGIRPYSKEKPCYLKEVTPGLWVATGGAKNGTIAAGWCAHEISRRTA